ncbi:hypothetical protein NDU88_000548 [Pleurodeles waltl]|uniref:Uncharacterized protein n=1 Tax=Pleurodeles waltl TaxID=8319 RepID=A0AAV7V9B2_PLEWA|nr:hypothetical protein NDU88_000548 [Pleurodeles waltl]
MLDLVARGEAVSPRDSRYPTQTPGAPSPRSPLRRAHKAGGGGVFCYPAPSVAPRGATKRLEAREPPDGCSR